MDVKKFFDSRQRILIFHVMTSLFYIRLFLIFMATKNIIFGGRMLTTWYLTFHIGFIFLRLIQDIINFTARKNSKFNEIVIKFNNLIFISLIFPFALYIPLVYWLLFFYDSSLMLPNFVEISLPTWVSISSHTVIASVALVEMTTTKYSYKGNHFSSVIIMSIFTAAYFACLIGTYVQYGFWLYPIFHFIPSNFLSFVFSALVVLLLFMYFVGKIIVQRFHESDGIDETTEKFVKGDIEEILSNQSENILKVQNNSALDENYEKFKKDDNKEILPISNGEVSEVQNNYSQNDFQNEDEKFIGSPLVILKKVLKNVILIPLRSNIQKMFFNENHHPSLKHSNRISSREISDPSEYVEIDEGDEIKSSSYLAAKKERKTPSTAVSKTSKKVDELTSEKNEHPRKRYYGKYHYSIQAVDDDHALNISLASNKNNPKIFTDILTKPLDNSPLSIEESNANSILSNPSAYYDIEEPSSLGTCSGSVYDDIETDNDVDTSHKNHENDEKSLKRLLPIHTAVSNEYVSNRMVKLEDERNKKQDNIFHFRLELYPNKSVKILPQNEGCNEKQKLMGENSGRNMNSETEKIIELDAAREVKIKDPKSKKKVNYFGNHSRESKTKRFLNSSTCQPTSSKLTAIHEDEKSLKKSYCACTVDDKWKLRSSSTNYADGYYSTMKSPKEKLNKRIEIRRNRSKHEENDSCSNEISPVMPCTSKSNFSNPLLMNFCAKIKTQAINSTLKHKSDKKILKTEVKKCNRNLIKIRDRGEKKLNVKDKCVNESENKPKKTFEVKCVNFCESDESNRKKRKYKKLLIDKKNGNKTKDEIEHIYNCKNDKRKYKPSKNKTGFRKMCTNHSTLLEDGKCKCKKIVNIKENQSTSVPERRDYDAPKTCEQLLSKKLTENKKNSDRENQRYELLPERNDSLKTINVTNYSNTLEKDSKIKKTLEEETYKKKSTSDPPVSKKCPVDSSNQSDDNTKKKLSTKFFKFSKRNQKAERDGKKFAKISKKYGNGSKSGAILTTISSENKQHPNIDIDDIEVLQNLHASLFSNDSKCKLYKFCAIVS